VVLPSSRMSTKPTCSMEVLFMLKRILEILCKHILLAILFLILLSFIFWITSFFLK